MAPLASPSPGPHLLLAPLRTLAHAQRPTIGQVRAHPWARQYQPPRVVQPEVYLISDDPADDLDDAALAKVSGACAPLCACLLLAAAHARALHFGLLGCAIICRCPRLASRVTSSSSLSWKSSTTASAQRTTASCRRSRMKAARARGRRLHLQAAAAQRHLSPAAAPPAALAKRCRHKLRIRSLACRTCRPHSLAGQLRPAHSKISNDERSLTMTIKSSKRVPR